MIERQAKTTVDIGLNGMLAIAEGGHFLVRGERAKLWPACRDRRFRR
jgi:hypothetical protein